MTLYVDFRNVLDFISPFGKNIDLETEEVTLAHVMKQIGPLKSLVCALAELLL